MPSPLAVTFQKLWDRPKSRWGIIAAGYGALITAALFAAPVFAQVEIIRTVFFNESSLFFDRAKNVTYRTISVTNTGQSVSGELRLVVGRPSVPVVNADGKTDEGDPYFFLFPGGKGTLGTNATSPPIRVDFQRSRTSIAYNLRLERVKEDQGTETIVTITTPADGTLTRANTVTLSGRAFPAPASVAINGVAATLSGETFSAEITLREGANMLTAVATDAAGKTFSATAEVIRDTSLPIVKIASPADNFVSANETITIAGQVNDSVGGRRPPTVSINGKAATVESGAFVVLGVPLVRGPNKITAVATDEAGNVAQDEINIVFERPAGARLTNFSGDGQSAEVRAELPQRLVTRIVDDLGNPVAGQLVTFEVSRNDGSLSEQASGGGRTGRTLIVPTNGNGEAGVFFTLGAAAGAGANRVIATALGAAGSIEFCATGRAKPAFQIVASMGFSQRAAVGQSVPEPQEVFVTDEAGNPAANVDVKFAIVEGGGQFSGQAEVIRRTGLDGKARAIMTLGPDVGINNNRATAMVEGLTGLPATFTASGVAVGAATATTFVGVVLDNALTPIPGAKVTIKNTTVEGVTDSSGQFRLVNVPVGRIILHIDPTSSPRSEKFPPLEFETTTVAGAENNLGQPIEIPPVDTGNTKVVGGAQDVTLTMEDVPGMSVTVFANSATFPNGAKTGAMSISQVAGDKVPMAPPNGIIFTPPVWTFQPGGVSFKPPARVQMPNTDGLEPGVVIDMYSFDHALNQFVSIGKGTVSNDGQFITSDAGFGIEHSGWGGGGPPPPPRTCVGEPPACMQCDPRTGSFMPKQAGSRCESKDLSFEPISGVSARIETSCSGVCTASGVCQPSLDGKTPDPLGYDFKSVKVALNGALGGLGSCVGPKTTATMRSELKSRSLVIQCRPNASECGAYPVSSNIFYFGKPWRKAGCNSESATALHELVHGFAFPGGNGPDHSNPIAPDDKAYACEKSCYPTNFPASLSQVRADACD